MLVDFHIFNSLERDGGNREDSEPKAVYGKTLLNAVLSELLKLKVFRVGVSGFRVSPCLELGRTIER
jgi:hypothetical protein